jgi:aryl-alcohol dehydrogenase-like predicted oxidoreductase
MQFTRLGSTGTTVSRLCLGMMTYGLPTTRAWALEEAEARPFVQKAIEYGFNFFDTADVYSEGASEKITGRALKDFASSRDEIVVATKVHGVMGQGPNMRGLSRKHIMQAIDASLTRLGMDYVDLYQIHRFDPATPMEETLEALTDVVKAGKALYIGASSMYAWQFAQYLALADRHGLSRFVTMQNHYNLLYREEEREMLPLCRDEGIGVIPWSPLARGRLAREWDVTTVRSENDGFGRTLYAHTSDADRKVAEALAAVATRLGRPRAQVALAWVLAKSEVTAPIVGATRLEQLDDAAAALTLVLAPEDIAELEAPYVPHPVIGID